MYFIDVFLINVTEFYAILDAGSCILVYEGEGSNSSDGEVPPLSLTMVGWRGTKSVRAYVPVNDCIHYLRLCGADVSKFGKQQKYIGLRCKKLRIMNICKDKINLWNERN